ncbi:hypothetical protein [Vibrio sp. R78045]|uniref:hypothetical protein n=1 Tax=Vibrio sp. R78045 TaxID=3093868 RepID=UPI0036F20E08
MSKLNNIITGYIDTICLDFSVPRNTLKYSGLSTEQALSSGYLLADIVFQMQHLALAFNSYISSIVVVDIHDQITPELYDIYDEATASHEQKKVIEDYYQLNHPRLTPATDQLMNFLLYAATRSALFNWKEQSHTRLAFGTMLVKLDEDVVVVDIVKASMRTLQNPNRLLHINIGHQIPDLDQQEPSINVETEV